MVEGENCYNEARSAGTAKMDYRLCHCLLNGLPLDQDVYDGVTWSSLVELTEQSVLKDGASVEVPDFTRGAWPTAQPLGIIDI